MKIIDIKTYNIKIPLRKPFITNIRKATNIENVIVEVITDEGLVGYGEGASSALVTGDTVESITSAIINYIKPSILGIEIDQLDFILERLNNCIFHNTSAKAAVDMAIYDLYSKYHKLPLYKLLGGYRKELYTNITISVNDVETMINDSIEAVSKGYKILKIKLGLNSDLDLERICKIREAIGPKITIRVDANQAWTPKGAIKIIRTMEDRGLDIELVEQPVHYRDLKGLSLVTNNVYTPILADESVFSPYDAMEVIKMRAADLINIKLIKTGGIYNALKICSIASIYGVECMIGCTLESNLSISASAHLASAKKIIGKVDLDGHNLCAYNPFKGGPYMEESLIKMTDKFGLGFENIII